MSEQSQRKRSEPVPEPDAPDPVEFAQAQAARSAERSTPTTVADGLALIAEALRALKAGDETAGARLAAMEQLLLTESAARPHENLFNPPMVSVFNPRGERDHPRPALRCRMLWVGYELNTDILTLEEIELLNQMEPGEYRVTKADGRVIRLTVTERQTDAGTRELLTFHFPCKDSEDRQNHQSMVAYLREALGLSSSRDALLAEVQALKSKLAAYTQQVAA